MNIIQQFKDASGNNIYPLAYAQGGVKMDLLWTNPSPTSSFDTQTVSINLSNYNLIFISFRISTGETNVLNMFFEKGTTTVMNMALDYIYHRYITASSDSGITFGVGQRRNSYAASPTTQNTILIPYQIYGVNMSYIVPTSVHGLQYVEV